MLPSKKVQRKLAAIVFTDIVGYTKLSGENEPAALALLEKQREILKPIVKEHGGNWLKEIGDGLLLSFNTNLEAVNCAITIQKAIKSIEDLNLRIGIHQGEVIFQGNDVVGDDVNIASRIEPFSAIGGIAISGRVNASLERDPDFKTKYLCKPKLKGVSQEVKIYCIISHDLVETDLSQLSAKLEIEKKFNWNIYNLTGMMLTVVGVFFWISVSILGIGIAEENEVPSIAILPLENKGAEEDEFYAYGISSDLISDVASAGLIRVASLNKIEDLGNISAEEKADRLDVRYIAEGSLWKRDTIFQLSMELYDTHSEKVVWSKRWQKSWNELPLIRDLLADNILDNLKVDNNSYSPKITLNPDAYEFYLKAKHKYEKRKNVEEIEIVKGLLNKAIELDNNLIAAKILLGDIEGENDKTLEIYTSALKQAEQLGDKMWIGRSIRKIGNNYYSQGKKDSALKNWEKSITIAEEIGDMLGMSSSLNNIGVGYFVNKDYENALEYYNRSLSINEELGSKSNIAMNLRNIGQIYRYNSDNEKALEFLVKALEIFEQISDKTGITNSLRQLAFIYKDKGDFDTALNYNIKSLQNYGDLGYGDAELSVLEWIGWAYFTMGKYDKSIEYYEKRINLDREFINKEKMAFIYSKLGFNYFYSNNNLKALECFEMSTKLSLEVQNEQLLQVKIYLSLIKKLLGREYRTKEILSIIEDEEKVRNYYVDQFGLYKLLEDMRYLEKAYNDIQRKANKMKNEFKEDYLNYPVQKQIIEEYNKLFS